MPPLSLQLPIRLVHHKRDRNFLGHFCLLLLSVICTSIGFFEDGGFHLPPPSDRITLVVVGLLFTLIALGGIVLTRLSRLPDSPYFHLEISYKGIVEKSWFFAACFFAWRELPEFVMVTSEHTRTEDGKEIVTESHCAVAQKIIPGKKLQEILSIDVSHYGGSYGLTDAVAMVTWFNQLRALAHDNRLDVNELIEVPENFRHSTIKPGAAQQAIRARQTTPAIKRGNKPSQKSVERS